MQKSYSIIRKIHTREQGGVGGDGKNPIITKSCLDRGGGSGGAMVLGKLPVPGRPTNLDENRARAYGACRGCGWGLFGHFYSHL